VKSGDRAETEVKLSEGEKMLFSKSERKLNRLQKTSVIGGTAAGGGATGGSGLKH
jgi:hypothetical protein